MNWKIDEKRSDAPPGFPIAIVHKAEVVAWFKNNRDAQFAVSAQGKIESAEMEANRQKFYGFTKQ